MDETSLKMQLMEELLEALGGSSVEKIKSRKKPEMSTEEVGEVLEEKMVMPEPEMEEEAPEADEEMEEDEEEF